jgi:hypothetical protein
MPIVSADIQYRLSGGAANASAAASLGGAKSSVVVPSGLFDDVSSAESAAGDTEYRCFYVHNNHGTLSLQSAVVWISANTTGNRIAIGVGTAAINGTEQTVADESTAPTTVTFSQPSTKGTGLALGTIPAGQHKAVWIRRVVAAASGAANDTYTIRAEGDTAA